MTSFTKRLKRQEQKDQRRNGKLYKIYPRSKVEKLLVDFIEEHKVYAQYGKDTEGLFNVQFLVEEETD